MTHVNGVKCVEVSKEDIPVSFEEAHVIIVSDSVSLLTPTTTPTPGLMAHYPHPIK